MLKIRNDKCRERLFGTTALAGCLSILIQAPAEASSALTASGAAGATAAVHAPSDQPLPTVGEVIVTATRRAQDVTKIPYNISSLGAQQLEQSGIRSLEDLSAAVPNLSLNSAGAASLAAERPVMRGLNASDADRPGQALEQASVALYLGNVPTGPDFPIDDVARVEVLRGPQGTLYGAGSLGGTVRVIPNDPRLNHYEGSITASVGGVYNSSDADYSVGGIVNVPIGDAFAVRLSGRHEYDAGFIDQISVFDRTGGPISPPVLANPSDPAGSAAVMRNIRNSNWTQIDSLRGSLKWQPNDKLQIVAAYNFAQYDGWGSPQDNPHYTGGADPLDSTVKYPATHDYQVVLRDELPYARRSQMASLDASYDLGFATLSSTTSYYQTRAHEYADSTYGVLALPAAYLAYYTGTPANPRFNDVSNFVDSDHTFTQEVRLVSSGIHVLDYTLGLYYQNEGRDDDWLLYIPGSSAQSTASGCNCVFPGPGDINSNTNTHTKFSDIAVFGETTWNITSKLHVTAGARVFWDNFSRRLDDTGYLFGILLSDSNSTSYSRHIVKLNLSYEYVDHHQFYATFSQGFRRGGANAFAVSGPQAEPISIVTFKPDTLNNYEFGLKGRFSNGIRYTIDGFLDDWQNPQIGSFTPFNVWPVVLNGKAARSIGTEFEISGPITSELSYSIGYAFSDAVLTSGFCIPAGDGAGGFVPCGIQGVKGERLPGAPQHTGSLNITYDHKLSNLDDILATANAEYKGDVLLALLSPGQLNPQIPGYWTANANVTWNHGPWSVSVYGRNIFNERGVVATDLKYASLLGSLQLIDQINRPISGGLKLGYRW